MKYLVSVKSRTVGDINCVVSASTAVEAANLVVIDWSTVISYEVKPLPNFVDADIPDPQIAETCCGDKVKDILEEISSSSVVKETKKMLQSFATEIQRFGTELKDRLQKPQ